MTAGTTHTVDTTGTTLAYGDQGSASTPNYVLVKVTAGTLLLGGAPGGAVFPVTSSDGFVEVSLVGAERLYGKTSSGTATVHVLESRGYTAAERALRLIKSEASAWYEGVDLTSPTQQSLPNRVNPGASPATFGSNPTAEDTNDPVRLDHDGDHYLWFPGEDGNRGAVIDPFDWNGTTLAECRFDVVFDRMTGLVGEDRITTDFGFFVGQNASNRLFCSYRDNVPGYRLCTFTDTPLDTVVSVGERVQFRVVVDTDAATATAYYRKEIVDLASDDNWTFMSSGSIGSGAPFGVGGIGGGIGGQTNAFNWAGRVHRVLYLNVDDDVTVFDLDVSRDVDTTSDPDAGQSTITALVGGNTVVNRSTTGRPTTVVTRPVMVLDGSDDYVQLPASDTPTFNKTTGKHTALVVFRKWVTQDSFDRLLSFESADNVGLYLGFNSADRITVYTGDGTMVNAAQPTDPIDGSLSVAGFVIDDGTEAAYLRGPGLGTVVSLDGIATEPVFGTGRVGVRGHVTGSRYTGEVFAVLNFPGVALTESQLDMIASWLIAGDYS